MRSTPGEGAGRRPSMADVAAHLGVSHQTVSRVLNDSPAVRPDTRERVLAAVKELGYRRNRAARSLATNRSGRLGLISAHLGLYGPSMMAVAIQEAGYRAGYDVALVGLSEFSPGLLEGAVDRLLDEAVEALVVSVAHREAMELTQSLAVPVPVVLLQGVTADQPMAAGIDQVAAGELATGHLLDLGHRQVAHLTGPLDWTEAVQRRTGWLRAHESRGLEPGPELSGDWSAGSGHAAGLVVAEDPAVTAVFAANDTMALGLLRALHQQGIEVPGRVSVVGVDDIPEAAYLWPALSTVAQDFASLGATAVDLVVRALGGEDAPVTDLLAPVMVARESSAAPA